MPNKPDIVILCGGLGTRFQTVFSDRPKIMAPIHGRPFLDILLSTLTKQGYNRFILCTGHLSDVIEQYVKKSPYAPNVVISGEHERLGTAGAIKLAESKIKSDHFFVINGDTFCDIDLASLEASHIKKRNIYASMVLAAPKNRKDGGSVTIDLGNKNITSFAEKKQTSTNAFINAGVYLFHKKILNDIPKAANYSLEHDVFPTLVGKGLSGQITNKPVLDIGTPERYKDALAYFAKNT